MLRAIQLSVFDRRPQKVSEIAPTAEGLGSDRKLNDYRCLVFLDAVLVLC